MSQAMFLCDLSRFVFPLSVLLGGNKKEGEEVDGAIALTYERISIVPFG